MGTRWYLDMSSSCALMWVARFSLQVTGVSFEQTPVWRRATLGWFCRRPKSPLHGVGRRHVPDNSHPFLSIHPYKSSLTQ